MVPVELLMHAGGRSLTLSQRKRRSNNTHRQTSHGTSGAPRWWWWWARGVTRVPPGGSSGLNTPLIMTHDGTSSCTESKNTWGHWGRGVNPPHGSRAGSILLRRTGLYRQLRIRINSASTPYNNGLPNVRPAIRSLRAASKAFKKLIKQRSQQIRQPPLPVQCTAYILTIRLTHAWA